MFGEKIFNTQKHKFRIGQRKSFRDDYEYRYFENLVDARREFRKINRMQHRVFNYRHADGSWIG